MGALNLESFKKAAPLSVGWSSTAGEGWSANRRISPVLTGTGSWGFADPFFVVFLLWSEL